MIKRVWLKIIDLKDKVTWINLRILIVRERDSLHF